MLSKVKCVTFSGLDVREVAVEVSVTRGIPSFEIVGLPNKSVEESKHRIKSAFLNCGFEFADSRITVNLAPADIHKVGSFYDLAIAVAIFCAKNNIQINTGSFFFGELSLDGTIRHTRGAYLAVEYVTSIHSPLFISTKIAPEVEGFDTSRLFIVENLKQVFDHLLKRKLVMPAKHSANSGGDIVVNNANPSLGLITDIVGQGMAKRGIEIAAAGGHNIMLVGSPGTGKSMLAKSILSILPPLDQSEITAIKRVNSYVGIDISQKVARPFRSPHNTISYSGMIGGGSDPMPGEVTLAHKGVLFMDEFCEFSRNVLEALRQPLQDGYTILTRNNMTYTFPCEFTLVAASNPCPCGYLGHATKACICTEQKISTYAKKLSGPLADRFDIFVALYPEVGFTSHIADSKRTDSSLKEHSVIIDRVMQARAMQVNRLKKYSKVCNSTMTNNEILTELSIDKGSCDLLQHAYKKFNLTPRGYFKVLKVARTIADLAQSTCVTVEHIAEALQFRLR